MFVGSLAVSSSFFLQFFLFFFLQPNEGFPCVWVCYRLPYTRMNFYSICKATTSCTIAVLNTRTTSQRANGHFVIPAEMGNCSPGTHRKATRKPPGKPPGKPNSPPFSGGAPTSLVTAICMSNCLHFAVVHLNAALVLLQFFGCCLTAFPIFVFFFFFAKLKIYLFMRFAAISERQSVIKIPVCIPALGTIMFNILALIFALYRKPQHNGPTKD